LALSGSKNGFYGAVSGVNYPVRMTTITLAGFS
jgi:hypothetical protein